LTNRKSENKIHVQSDVDAQIDSGGSGWNPYYRPIPVGHLLRSRSAPTTARIATRGIQVVYYIRLPNGLIKIGTSSQMLDRLRRHRHDRGEVEVLAIEPGGRDLEAERHQQFAELRVGRFEHFEPGDELLAHIADLRQSLGLAG
jgi:hypothetical protein